MPKRGENIRKRKDGRYEARVIDFYKENGKPHYKSIYSKSYTEVKNLKKDFYMKKDKYLNKEKPIYKNIADMCNEWLNKIYVKIKPSTYATYHRIIHNHIIPYFTNIELKDITNANVQKFIDNKYITLSAKTIRDITAVLLQILKYAEKEKYISDFNYDVCLPKLEKKEFELLSTIEEEKLNNYLKNNLTLINFGVILAKETGLRIGELCALQLGDIDLTNGTININKTIQRIKNFNPDIKSKTKIISTTPKSQKSVRIIPLPDNIMAMVKKLYKNYSPESYVLTGTSKYIEPRLFQKKFKEIMDYLDIENTTVHSMRHLFATKAVENEFDAKSLSEILGHATVKFTLDTYVHSSFELKRKHMNKMASGF